MRKIYVTLLLFLLFLYSCKKQSSFIVENDNNIFSEEMELSTTSDVVDKYRDVDLSKVKTYLDYPIVKYGYYLESSNQSIEEPIEWLVLESNDNGVLLLSKEVLAVANEYGQANFFDSRYSIKGDFNIDINNIYTSYLDGEHWKINEIEETTYDKFFNLTKEDIKKYFGEVDINGINMKAAAMAHNRPKSEGISYGTKNNEYKNYAPYYLSSLNDNGYPMWIGEYGHLYEEYDYEKNKSVIGVRPACWINIKYQNLDFVKNSYSEIAIYDTDINNTHFDIINDRCVGVDNDGFIINSGIVKGKNDKYYCTDSLGEKVTSVGRVKVSNSKSYYLNNDTTVYMGKELLNKSEGVLYHFNPDHSIKDSENLFRYKKVDDVRIIEGCFEYDFDYYTTNSVNEYGKIEYSAHMVDEDGHIIVPDDGLFGNNESWIFMDFNVIDKNKKMVKQRRVSKLGTFILKRNVVVDNKTYIVDNDGYIVKNDIFFENNNGGKNYNIYACDGNGVVMSSHGSKELIDINKSQYILLDTTIAHDKIIEYNSRYYYTDYDGKILKNIEINNIKIDNKGIITGITINDDNIEKYTELIKCYLLTK